MPGGVIAPDGRPSQAPGVGATAKRHDLEGTPGLSNSSLQQGDVQMLEEGQQSLKQKQAPATGGKAPAPAAKGGAKGPMQVPDAIDFIAGRQGGTLDANLIGSANQSLDVARWRPLLEELARDPGSSGPITTMLLSQLGNMNRQPSTAAVDIIDMNAVDDAVARSLNV